MKCFSKPGWWHTLCGRDVANQTYIRGWTSNLQEVGCGACLKRIQENEHERRTSVLMKNANDETPTVEQARKYIVDTWGVTPQALDAYEAAVRSELLPERR